MGYDSSPADETMSTPSMVLVVDDFFATPYMQEIARLTHPNDPEGRFVFDFSTSADEVIEKLKHHKLNNTPLLGITLDSLGPNREMPGTFNFEEVLNFMMVNGLDIPVCIISTSVVAVYERVNQLRQHNPQLRIMFLEKGGEGHLSLIHDPARAFADVRSLVDEANWTANYKGEHYINRP